jgi:hypothetical protein
MNRFLTNHEAVNRFLDRSAIDGLKICACLHVCMFACFDSVVGLYPIKSSKDTDGQVFRVLSLLCAAGWINSMD